MATVLYCLLGTVYLIMKEFTKEQFEEFIGEIWYIGEDKKSHRYYPDIFIISENKIIEVKSDWTFNLHKNMNLLKKESCINSGIDFEFFIFNKKQRIESSTL